METKSAKKKTKGGRVSRGQQALLPEEMGYDVCMLDDSRHEVFCREYAMHKNGTKAYLLAYPGVKPTSAGSNSCELLKNTDIVRRIRAITRERMEKLEVTHERILQEVAKLAFLDPRAFYRNDGSMLPISEMDPDAVAALEGVKIKTTEFEGKDGAPNLSVQVTEIKHSNKRAALELLMRHKEMLTDRVAADVTHGGVVGMTEDLAKLDALRTKIAGGAHGATRATG